MANPPGPSPAGSPERRQSLAQELSRAAGRRPRITVLGHAAIGLPCTTFLRQLGWLDDTVANTAVLPARTSQELVDGTRALHAAEQRHGRRLALGLVAPGELREASIEVEDGRTPASVPLPPTFGALLGALGAARRLEPSQAGAAT